MSQLEIFEESLAEPGAPTLASLGFGKIFKLKRGGKNTYMKVKTVNFLNNSEVLSDIFSRGDCLVVMLERGSVNYMKGATEVIKLTGTLKISRDV